MRPIRYNDRVFLIPRYVYLAGTFPDIERGKFAFRRAGIPRSPTSKRFCELFPIADPEKVVTTRTDIVLWDDQGPLGNAYLEAYATVMGYSQLYQATSDPQVASLFHKAELDLYKARLEIEKIVLVKH